MVAVVSGLFSREEWAKFVDTGTDWARERGMVFMLDESARLLGERALAARVHSRMKDLGLEEFASRIRPDDFPEGELALLLKGSMSRS